MMYGNKVLLMSDADLRSYLFDIADYISKYFKEENREPTLEEFTNYLVTLIEEDFMELNEQEIEAIMYKPLDDSGKSVIILTPEQFLELVEHECNIEDVYKEFIW